MMNTTCDKSNRSTHIISYLSNNKYLRSKRVALVNFLLFILCVAVVLRNGNNIRSRTNTKAITPKLSNKNASSPKQRVVLLAGPHKTGSTSIQLNMFHWLNNETHHSGLAKHWAWPSPLNEFRELGCIPTYIVQNEPYRFLTYHWVWAMRDLIEKPADCMFSSNGTQLYSPEEYLGYFSREFHHQWVNGRGLVIASEELDIIGNAEKGKGILKQVVQQLPWHTSYLPTANGSDEDVIAVVVYRSPRSDHLLSMWHECCMETESFEEYLLSLKARKWFAYHPLDSLKLASSFLRRGLQTILIDMAGVLDKGYDISNVIACNVLGASCTAEKRFVGDDAAGKSIVANVKKKSHSISAEKMQQIHEVIERYDCNFVLMLDHPKLTILYSLAIEKLRERCLGVEDSELTDMKTVLHEISGIARNKVKTQN